jgi:hypothetical protein
MAPSERAWPWRTGRSCGTSRWRTATFGPEAVEALDDLAQALAIQPGEGADGELTRQRGGIIGPPHGNGRVGTIGESDDAVGIIGSCAVKIPALKGRSHQASTPVGCVIADMWGGRKLASNTSPQLQRSIATDSQRGLIAGPMPKPESRVLQH